MQPILDVFKNMEPMQLIFLGLVAYLFLTGKLKLSDLWNLLKPTPVPVPPGQPPADTTLSLIQLLLSILSKAKAEGDKETEEAATKLLSELTKG